jgi:hypothetical protein
MQSYFRGFSDSVAVYDIFAIKKCIRSEKIASSMRGSYRVVS